MEIKDSQRRAAKGVIGIVLLLIISVLTPGAQGQQKIYDDNNENKLQEEIVFFLNFARDIIYKNLKKAGVDPASLVK